MDIIGPHTSTAPTALLREHSSGWDIFRDRTFLLPQLTQVSSWSTRASSLYWRTQLCKLLQKRQRHSLTSEFWHSTPELGRDCPKSSKIHPPIENDCLCGRAHTSVCLHSVAPVCTSTPQWVPKHFPCAQLCYGSHNCWQRDCLGEQGGLNIGVCCISSLQGSREY